GVAHGYLESAGVIGEAKNDVARVVVLDWHRSSECESSGRELPPDLVRHEVATAGAGRRCDYGEEVDAVTAERGRGAVISGVGDTAECRDVLYGEAVVVGYVAGARDNSDFIGRVGSGIPCSGEVRGAREPAVHRPRDGVASLHQIFGHASVRNGGCLDDAEAVVTDCSGALGLHLVGAVSD